MWVWFSAPQTLRSGTLGWGVGIFALPNFLHTGLEPAFREVLELRPVAIREWGKWALIGLACGIWVLKLKPSSPGAGPDP